LLEINNKNQNIHKFKSQLQHTALANYWFQTLAFTNIKLYSLLCLKRNDHSANADDGMIPCEMPDQKQSLVVVL